MSKIVDTEQAVQDMITAIIARPQSFLFLDLEGVKLSRRGPISILQILVPPDPTVYLVDVHILGDKAFSTSTAGDTLRSILQSKDIAKVFFDVRRDSDALFHQFSVNLQSVIDLQVMEFMSRVYQGQFLRGLAQCIQEEKPNLNDMFHDWERKKSTGRHLFLPELGGSYDILLQRPIPKAIVDYCVSDVLVMPALLLVYGKRIGTGPGSQIQRLTNERITLSQSPSLNSQGPHMARGPNRNRARSDTDKAVFPMTLVCSPALEGICHIEKTLEAAQPKLTERLDTAQDLMNDELLQNMGNLLRGQSARTKDEVGGSGIAEEDEMSQACGSSGAQNTGHEEATESKSKPEDITRGRNQPPHSKGSNSSGLHQNRRTGQLPLEDRFVNDFLFDDDVDDHLDDFLYTEDDVDHHLEDFQ